MNILDIAIAKKLAGGGGGSGTDNYNDLSNLPKINDTTLSGNKSSSALGLQSEINSDSKLASDLVDDTNQDNKFVTSTEKNTWNAKQNAIDADHKINADYVDDSTSTNKFVTASDKETWNAKQNAIDNSHKLSSDLVDDTNHTNKFVTSTEKQTWNAKQNAIDADHKLSSSLVSFTTAEAAALASGIDSSKVRQISTNQTNILYALETGAANYAPLEGDTVTGSNNFLDATRTGMKVFPSGTVLHVYCEYTKASNSQLIVGMTNSAGSFISGCEIYTPLETTTSVITADVTLTQDAYGYLGFYSGSAGDTCTVSKVMICPKTVWDAIQKYVPYSVPNYDLTRLEAEDRASLAEVVDSGAKNLFIPDIMTSTPITIEQSGLTVTRQSDGTSVKINGTYTGSDYIYIFIGRFKPVEAGTYCMSVEATKPLSVSTYYVYTNDSKLVVSSDDTVKYYNYTTAPDTTVVFRVAPNTSFNNDTLKILLCTKAAFDMSQKLVPYRPDYDTLIDIVDKKAPGLGLSVQSGSLNDLSTSFVVCTANVTDKPIDAWGFVRTSVADSNTALQEFFAFSSVESYNGMAFVRVKQGGTWKSWKQITNA